MEYFRVRNWTTYQHYSKRNPPWIKVYTSLLDDFDFLSLPESTRLLALFVMMLAAKTHNKMPNNPKWLMNRFQLSELPDLSPLFSYGLIEPIDASNMMLADDASISRGEQRRNKEREDDQKVNSESSDRRGAFDLGIAQLKERLSLPR